MEKIKVLFVCMGNICRSPTAHGVFQKLVDEAGLSEQILVDSAGTISYHAGEAPDPRSSQTALAHGIDLSPQRSRQVNDDDFERQDYILAMDYDNLRNLQQQCPDQYQHKLQLLLSYHSDQYLDEVPDPYYGGADGFETVFEMINEACGALLSNIRSTHSI